MLKELINMLGRAPKSTQTATAVEMRKKEKIERGIKRKEPILTYLAPRQNLPPSIRIQSPVI